MSSEFGSLSAILLHEPLLVLRLESRIRGSTSTSIYSLCSLACLHWCRSVWLQGCSRVILLALTFSTLFDTYRSFWLFDRLGRWNVRCKFSKLRMSERVSICHLLHKFLVQLHFVAIGPDQLDDLLKLAFLVSGSEVFVKSCRHMFSAMLDLLDLLASSRLTRLCFHSICRSRDTLGPDQDANHVTCHHVLTFCQKVDFSTGLGKLALLKLLDVAI